MKDRTFLKTLRVIFVIFVIIVVFFIVIGVLGVVYHIWIPMPGVNNTGGP